MNYKFIYSDDSIVIGYRDNVIDYIDALIPSLDWEEVEEYFKELKNDILNKYTEDDLVGFKSDVMDYEVSFIDRVEIGIIVLDLIDRNILKLNLDN